MHRTTRTIAGVAASVLLATLAVGGPAWAEDPPVTLRLATGVPEDNPLGVLIKQYAADVAGRTGGSVVVEPVWSAAGDLPKGGDDQAVVARVTSGELEMALAPSRGFDDSGSTALLALQTPFLIDNDALADAVATGDVGVQALDALAPAGLVGLAMWADGLRHLKTFELNPDPFLSPTDVAGKRIRSVVSKVSWDLLSAYGAKVSQINGFDARDYDGEEQMLDGRGGAGYIATGNVTFFPRYQVLVVDDAAFARLSDAQQAALRDAALTLRDAGRAGTVSEAQAALNFCADGGRVVDAPADGVAAFKAGAQPVIDALTQDPATADLVAAISALKARTPASPGAAPCEPAPLPTGIPSIPAWVPAALPEGVYRASVGYDDLVAAGATPVYASNNHGVWTMRVDATGEPAFDLNGGPNCPTTAQLLDRVVRISFTGAGCDPEKLDIQWTEVDGGIALTTIALDPIGAFANENALWTRTWKKIE